ncbi:MAG: cytochrome c, partial [Bacteroidota bacterium]
YQQGYYLYRNYCANCHMDDGTGLAKNIPTIVGADYIAKHREQLPCIIHRGLVDTIVVNGTTYNEAMPGFPKLTEAEVANIINYMLHEWNSEVKELNMKEVREGLANCD